MKGNLDACLKIVFTNEGGYVNNPHDPGGATNFGITQRVFNSWRRLHKESLMTVRRIDKSEAADIYQVQYAAAIRFDELPIGVDLCALDEDVNSGPVEAIKDLQRALGVKADGHLGLLTMEVLKSRNDIAAVINHMCDQRLGFLRALKNWRYFRAGWKTRVARVRSSALAMATVPADPLAKAA